MRSIDNGEVNYQMWTHHFEKQAVDGISPRGTWSKNYILVKNVNDIQIMSIYETLIDIVLTENLNPKKDKCLLTGSRGVCTASWILFGISVMGNVILAGVSVLFW